MADFCLPDPICDLQRLMGSLRQVGTSLYERIRSARELPNPLIAVDPDLRHLEEDLSFLDATWEHFSVDAVTRYLHDSNLPPPLSDRSESAIQNISVSLGSLRMKEHIVEELGSCFPSADLFVVAVIQLQRRLRDQQSAHDDNDGATHGQGFINSQLHNLKSSMPPEEAETSYKAFRNSHSAQIGRVWSYCDTGIRSEESCCKRRHGEPQRCSEDNCSRSISRNVGVPHICWEGPAKVLRKWDAGGFSLLTSSAKALSEIGQLTRWLRFGKLLEVCMPQDKIVACQELADCAGWLLIQPLNEMMLLSTPREYTVPLSYDCHHCDHRCLGSRKASENKEDTFMEMLPETKEFRHFAKRGALCFFSSLRLWTATELFEAAVTKVLDSDIDWPFPEDDFSSNVQRFMRLCENFLGVDAEGRVRLRTLCLVDFFEEYLPISAKDGHFLMALLCLIQLRRHPRLILRPWLDFNDFQERSNEFRLHSYAVTYWYIHYREAGDVSTYLSDRLHLGIQAAWVAERSAMASLDPGHPFSNVDMGLHLEVVTIGLEICRAYGIRDLEATYRRMGADTYQKFNESSRRHSVTSDKRRDSPILFSANSKSSYNWSINLPHRARAVGNDQGVIRNVSTSNADSVENRSSGKQTPLTLNDSGQFDSEIEADWVVLDSTDAEGGNDCGRFGHRA